MYKTYTKNLYGLKRPSKQFLRMMKLTILILFTSLMQLSATTLGQVVTLKRDHITLKDAFAEIKTQTGYNLFTSSRVKLSTKVTANFDRQPLAQVIQKLLNGLPLEFSIAQNTIVIKEKQTSFIESVTNAILVADVKGKVLDENGRPLRGASVSIKGSSYTVTTDENGNFVLKNVAPDAIVIIVYVGFEPREIPASSNLGQIKLVSSTSKLDEVMVVAYGTTTKRLSTGSVSQINAADLEKQPISNPILALQGRVSGAFITQSAGFAGAPVNVVIRGQNSLQALTNNITAPLYIVDGVPFSSTPVEQSVGGFQVSTAFSPLNTIDPNQIESINILKDADATAIYGSRGANGVVLITTKKGKGGDTQIDVNLSAGFGEVTNTIKMATTEQYLAIRRQAFANDNVTPTAVNAPDLVLWSPSTYNNFPDIIMGGTQQQRKATVAISGGNEYNQFLLSGNYRHESSVMPSNTADNAFQFHTSSQHRSRNNKFGANVSVSYNLDNNAIPSYNISVVNYGLAPNYPLYNSNGSLYFDGGNVNPLASFNSIYRVKSTNLITNGSLSYAILPELSLKVNGGYNYSSTFASTVVPVTAANPATNPEITTTMSNNYINTYIVEPQANYAHSWGKSKLTILAGATWQETQLVQPYFILGTATNIQLATSLSALNILSKSSNTSDYKYVSGFGRVAYEWDGKYLVSANIRRDGSSRFGTNNPYGNFGSGAAAWVFSKENFIKENLNWLSFGKLRLSYGVVGNDKTLTDYAYLSTYTSNLTYGTANGIRPSRIPNPNLQWEETKKFDAAIEMGFLKDRLFLSAGVYRNRASHLLASISIPSQSGFQSYSGNLPDGAVIQNQGLELEATSTNIKRGDFSWTSSFNLTVPQNKLLSFPGLNATSYANTLVVGESLNVRNVYHHTGIVNGIATAQDVNGDGIITQGLAANGLGDRIVYGSNDPKFYGGLSNTFTYKGFTLDFLFQIIKRTATRGDQNFTSIPGYIYNLPQSYLDVPLKYTATAGTPAFSSFSYYSGSDAAIADASFIRLKNVAFSYRLPSTLVKKLKISGLQFYLHGQNLLTFTKYKGLDPETLTTQLPTLKMLVAGIRTTL